MTGVPASVSRSYTLAADLADRLIAIFRVGPDGRRPVFGGASKFQDDPHWRDQILFYEYFHGDEGAGLGASHQTGWTGLVACLVDEWKAAEGEERRKDFQSRPAPAAEALAAPK